MRFSTILLAFACIAGFGSQAQTPTINGLVIDTVDSRAETFDGDFKPTANTNVAAQDGIITYDSTQYISWFNSDHRLCLARRSAENPEWQTIVFTDYLKTSTDSHNGIAIGISADDGAIHLAFDNHADLLNYRRSLPGLTDENTSLAWDQSSFLPVEHELVPGNDFTTRFTYPRFVPTENGDLLLHYRSLYTEFNNRIAYYDAQAGAWTEDYKVISGSGTYTDTLYGTSLVRRMYDNRVTSDAYHTLTTSFTWRENDVPDSLSTYNHDIAFMYSDDDGRTWFNNDNAVVTNTSAGVVANIHSPDMNVAEVAPAYKMINDQGHAVDPRGGVHVVMNRADEPQSNYGFAGVGNYHYYHRKADGTWTTQELPFRGERPRLMCDNFGNLLLLYSYFGGFYIATASPTDDYAHWSLLYSMTSDFGNHFNADYELLKQGVLSVLAQANPAVLGDPTPFFVMTFDLTYDPLPCGSTDEPCEPVSAVLIPEDDTFTRGGAFADDTLGLEKKKVLAVKYAANNGNKHVDTYLRFNVHDLKDAGRLTEATLTLHVKKAKGNNIAADQYALWRCEHNFWTEEVLSFNWPLKPGLQDAWGVQNGNPDSLVWDVTELMREELLGDDWLTLAIAGVQGSTGHLVFQSKEGNDADLRPSLRMKFADNESLPPTDDAHVRGGTYADDNFGNLEELLIKEDGNDSYDRFTYLKFDVSAYAGKSVKRVYLRMDKKTLNSKAHTTPYAAYRVADDAWDEATITFNNRPAMDTALLDAHYGRDAMRWDVTAAFDEAKDSDGTLSLGLKSLLQGPMRNVNLYSKEYPDSSLHPRLVVLFGNGAPAALPAPNASMPVRFDTPKPRTQSESPVLFPNPTGGVFRVAAPFAGAFSLQVFTATGMVMRSYSVAENENRAFSVTDLPAGLYFVRIVDGQSEEVHTVRLIRK